MEWKDFDRGVFLVNVLGIIYDPESGNICIGRRENDPYLKDLSWCFPGGRPGYEDDLEPYLKKEVKVKTNLDINIKEVIFAKTYPEKREFLSIYYYCELAGGEAKPGEKFVEVKWIKPTEVQKYFSTSVHPKIFEFLKSLENKRSN